MPFAIKKWGHSLGLRIPRPLADQVGLVDGSSVEISVVNGSLKVTPAAGARHRPGRVRLKEIVASMKRRTPTVDWGGDAGEEVIR